jgi:hypothetical protein
MSLEDSLEYHWQKHGAGKTKAEYIDDAIKWAECLDLKDGTPVTLADGTTGYRFRTPGGGPGGIVDASGNVITFWYA